MFCLRTVTFAAAWRAWLASLVSLPFMLAMMNDTAFASDSPQLSDLQMQFERCSPISGGWNRIEDNDRTRYTVWEGQDSDGKKWDQNMPEGKQAFPFDGANDGRIPLADELIGDGVDLLTEAFHRAGERVQGTPETEASGKAAYARKLLSWVKGTKQYGQLLREVELAAQNALTYGATLWEVGWERQIGYRRHTITLTDLANLQQRAAEGADEEMQTFALLPLLIADANQDDLTVAVLQKLYLRLQLESMPSNFPWEPRELSSKTARKALHELREGEKAELPLPYLCKNEPVIRARKLWEDVFLPEETEEIQKAPVIFTLEWLCEADLRARAKAEDWDEEWVEQAVKHKGEFSQWTDIRRLSNTMAIESNLSYTDGALELSDLIEITTAWRKQVDDDGVLGVYVTVYHQLVKNKPGSREELVAWHGLQQLPIGVNYPFVEYRREWNKRALLASRGIPQIVHTWQRALKVQEDSLTDRTSFETLPPIIVPRQLGVDYRFKPAGQVPVARMDLKPEFMSPPKSGPTVAFELMDRIEKRADRYFGRRRPDLVPESALIKQQRMVRSFLYSGSQVLQFMFQLMVQLMPMEDIEAITGSREPFGTPDQIERETAFLLTYDTQEFSPEFIETKLKVVSEIAASDPSGTIDQAKLTRYKLRALDPNLEMELCTDVQGASQAIFTQVKNDFANMALGVPAPMVENDPTSAQQLKFAEQIVMVSPKYQELLKNDPNFQELVQTWVKNRQFSLTQMANQQIGRVGVSPDQQVG